MISNFKKKQKGKFLKSNFSLFFIFIISLVICCALIYANFKLYKKRQILNLQLNNLKEKIENIEKTNNNLQNNILSATDDNYIEKVAREQLDLQKKDEKVVGFIINSNESNNNKETELNNKNWFLKMWQGFMELFTN